MKKLCSACTRCGFCETNRFLGVGSCSEWPGIRRLLRPCTWTGLSTSRPGIRKRNAARIPRLEIDFRVPRKGEQHQQISGPF